jgi:hypothetical protein
MFFPSEIDQLHKLCRSDDDTGGAYFVDLLPRGPRLSARQLFECDLDTA